MGSGQEPPARAPQEQESATGASHGPPTSEAGPLQLPFREIPPGPTFTGVLAITLAAFLGTLGALFAISDWDPNNIPSSVIIDFAAAALAYWVDMRAALAWRRFRGVRAHDPG